MKKQNSDSNKTNSGKVNVDFCTDRLCNKECFNCEFLYFLLKYQNLYICVNCVLPTNDLRRQCAHNDADVTQTLFKIPL